MLRASFFLFSIHLPVPPSLVTSLPFLWECNLSSLPPTPPSLSLLLLFEYRLRCPCTLSTLLPPLAQVRLFESCGPAFAESASELYDVAMAYIAQGAGALAPHLLQRAVPLLLQPAPVSPGKHVRDLGVCGGCGWVGCVCVGGGNFGSLAGWWAGS